MYDDLIAKLIDDLSRLPGIGPKSAQRMAFFLLDADKNYIDSLTDSIHNAKYNMQLCEICGNTSTGAKCIICANKNRDQSLICVVEEPRDLLAIEKTNGFKGLYHVLGGVLDPLHGMNPEDLSITKLIERLKINAITEVILATNPNIEGEATASYLANLIKPLNIKVTRLAQGLPIGSDLEYADEMTLARAMGGRFAF